MLVVPLRWKLPWTRCWTLLSFKRMFVYGNCMKFGPKMGGNHQSHPCKTACLRLQVIMKYCTVEDVWINHFGWRLCIGFLFLVSWVRFWVPANHLYVPSGVFFSYGVSGDREFSVSDCELVPFEQRSKPRLARYYRGLYYIPNYSGSVISTGVLLPLLIWCHVGPWAVWWFGTSLYQIGAWTS